MLGQPRNIPEPLRRIGPVMLHGCTYHACMQTIDFELDRDFVELNQLLKLAGLCDSGGAGKQLVASGAVRVDGEVELRKTAKLRAGQVVTLDDVAIRIVAIR